jgi:hypothetical protein
MGVAFVKGLQGDDPRYLKVASAPKHLAVHSGPEPSRHRDDIRVSARDLHETYLPHFKAVVQEADAAAVMSAYNPAGRTPITWPLSLDQLPPFEEYAMKGRTYRFMEAAPLFRFGYGLSYTRFRYGNLRVKRMGSGDSMLSVTCDVSNVGARDGDEVAQLYVSDVKASVPVPRVHLEGFRRIRLAKGARKKLSFTLTAAQLSAYNDEGRPFFEPGEFTLSIGGGQPDDPASGAVSATVLL